MPDIDYFGRPLTLPPPQPVRTEQRPCAACGQPIQPGQMYAVGGPEHIGCTRGDR